MTDAIYGLVGEQNNASGTMPPLAAGRQGELLTSDLHVLGYHQAKRDRLQFAYVAPGVLSAAGTAMTGLILWNGSAVNDLVLVRANLVVSVTSASLTGIGLGSTAAGAQTTAPTSTTGVTRSGSCRLGGAAGSGVPYSVATTLAVTTFATLMHNTAAIATTGVDSVTVDLTGFVIPPWTAVALTAIGAASASAAVQATILWEEVPV